VALAGCGSLFFLPQQQLVRSPANLGLAYEDVTFASADGTLLHGWFLPAQGAVKGTILFFHGNAENISTHIGAVYWLPEQGYNLFLPDYRGFGRSQGSPDIAGVQQDAAAALAYLRQRPGVDQRRLVVFDQSIGGAIALTTVAEHGRDLKAVIVESAFSGYRTIAREKLAEAWLTWPLQWPLAYTIDDAYSPMERMARLDGVAKLFIYGTDDEIVPFSHGERLYGAAGGERELWVIPGGRHIEAFGRFRDVYRPALLAYLERVLGPP
jgi:fermentation-respiration switch protein FrsA (DUF1100 family)